MNIFIYHNNNQLKQSSLSTEHIKKLIHHISEGTDISALVIALYFLPGIHQTRGIYLRKWINPSHFRTGRGKWAFTSLFELPSNLPEQFRLIRMRLDGRQQFFPREDHDAYGWCFNYQNLEAQLATLFAHELHHYRRYHLNLHPNEGEHSANRWALSRVRSLGYRVTGERMKIKKQKRRKRFLFPQFDPFKEFRKLKTGDQIIIKIDPHHRYTNQIAQVLRPMRSNSKRIVLETQDGKQYRWPIPWLIIK